MRLRAYGSRRAALVAAAFVALPVLLIAVILWLYAPRQRELMFPAILIVPVALVTLIAVARQLLGLGLPVTIVKTDREVWKRGQDVEITFRQRGKGSFEWLRATLVGVAQYHGPTLGTFDGTYDPLLRRYPFLRHNRPSVEVRELGTVEIFESGPFEAPYEATVRVRVPELPRVKEKMYGEHWDLVVEGNVRGRPDFRHVYHVEVD